jgi:hypothetical protein
MSVYRDVGNQILQKSGERISYLLSRKKSFGADPTLPARIRSADAQLRSLPKSYGRIPVVKRPEFPVAKEVSPPEPKTFESPTPPKDEPFSAEEWRRQELERKSGEFGKKLTGWDLLVFPRLITERLVAYLLSRPDIVESLSRERGK